MKPFNQSLQQAKKRHQRLYLMMLIGLLLMGLLILTALLVSRGTRIIVKPEAALPVSVNVEQGLGMALFGSVYSLTSSPTIRVTADGYYPHEQVIQPAEQGKLLTVTLKPLPSKITFSTDLADGRTTWQLNDNVVAVADTFEQILPPSDYQLSVNHPHYQPETIDFSLAAGEQLEQTVSLTPVAGALQIGSTPAGATVIIDGKKVGETPLEMPVAGGFYDVAVSMPAFASTTETIEITQQVTTAERHYRLQAEQASIKLDLQPTGGTLTVNGIAVNATEQLSVEAGKNHKITYQKPGYVPQTQTTTVNSKQSVTLAFDLPEENGDVAINAHPEATVEINGEAVGTTPLNLSLQAVPQEITLSRPGYRTVSQTVTPSSASAKTVSVTLLPEAEAQLAEAPRSYQTAAGGEMVLFTPNETFTMGAARDEAGQRANEFLRQIKLFRPFYAGVHEVTTREYQQFKSDHPGDGSLPVTSVSWLQAVQFSNWLSKKENLQPVYMLNSNQLTGIDDNANGYRLLSEAEWEWLARKANRSKTMRFVWGDAATVPKNAANIADESAKTAVSTYVPRYNDSYAGIAPVKHFARELSGLYDMGGNVSEWTHNAYSLIVPNAKRIYDQQLDNSLAETRVIKGANWRSGSLTELRASYRDGLSQPRDNVGFRIGRYLNRGEP